ncbi:homoprotocatechuate degradation operon regulator HpaR [Advenella alkanexedens]|uniref:Homoprotocatechuate degradation operon regulator HpaR n=1 Tax=Advenella alkanexedens TaxID=1481665 RepID=A0ABS6NKR6_9BURK|nr:homoprotocatechuate degradation operon regulator HpaR [Advenella alkanexedens]MBV4396217.1 homoprotocatechuate degradation operon regulator HpaR [Advenella alkanexedens]
MSSSSYRSLPSLLLNVREALMVHFRPLLHAEGLTDQQWRVLRALGEQEPMAPNQLSSVCMLLGPSLTRMLTGMEQVGLISRSRSQQDQRKQEVYLTEKGQALLARIKPLIENQHNALEEKIGKALMDRVYRDLDSLLEKIPQEVVIRK